MIDRIKTFRAARWGIAGAIVLAVGVAGAATKLKHTSVGDACLCTPDAQSSPDAGASIDPARASSGYMARSGAVLPGASSTVAGALVPETLHSGTSSGGGAAARGAAAGGVAWGSGSGNVGARSASSHAGGGASLGGLWRLMSLSRRSPHAAAHAASTPRAAAAPRSPRAVNPRPPSSGSGSTGGGSLTTPAQIPAAADDLFAEQTTSIPDLLSPGGTAVGSGPGAGGSVSKSGDPAGLAATPEPGTLLLLCTGLLGIAHLLRRRLA